MGTPLRFRFEYPFERGTIDVFSYGPHYEFVGCEALATISEASSHIWGRGCGSDGFEIVKYHASVTEDGVVRDGNPGPSQIPYAP